LRSMAAKKTSFSVARLINCVVRALQALELNLLVWMDFRQCKSRGGRVLIGVLDCRIARLRSKLAEFDGRIIMAGKLSTALVAGLVTAALALSATNPARAQDKQAWEAKPMPKVGDIAPDFTLQYFDGNDEKKVSLSDYRGKKNVVLAFFIFAFTGG